MDKNAIKKYAVWARRELISRVSQRAALYGITEKDIGDASAASVNGHILSETEKKQRQALIAQIRNKGYQEVMEEVAYTWFNRFSALRFMEVNGYLPSHVRVFTDDENAFKPQILTEAINLEIDGIDMEKVYALKNANDNDELFKYLIIVQCNALSEILPGMFQRIADYTELLFPDNLLREGSAVEQMIALIPQEDWQDAVQILGWLYQYYNTEKKDDVFAALKKNVKITKENIPAATQLFTPDWIVRYMVENSLGRIFIEKRSREGIYEDGRSSEEMTWEQQETDRIACEKAIAEEMGWKYYLEEARQEPEVRAQLEEIRKEYAAIQPEEIKVIDPCMGSGHILAYMFDVLMQIYEAYGYTAREAVASIVENNIYGLDIDERAAQLAYFAVMMKARQYDRRFFSRGTQPHVYAIQESNDLDSYVVEYFCDGRPELKKAMKTLMDELYDAREYGSILNVSQVDFVALYARVEEIREDISIYREAALAQLVPFIQCAEAMAQKYHAVVTNPPYMGASGMGAKLSDFVKKNYPDSKSDLFAVFIERCGQMTAKNGYQAMITQHAWMFLSSYEIIRTNLSDIINMAHLGARAFEEIAGEIVQTTSFVTRKNNIATYKGRYSRLVSASSQIAKEKQFLAHTEEFTTSGSDYSKIPGNPIAYWLTEKFITNFKSSSICDEFIPKFGMSTGDGERFIRFWHEIDYSRFNCSLESEHQASTEDVYWVALDKGGQYRKWYGNRNCAVWWENNGEAIKNCKKSAVRSPQYFFTPHISWTLISSGHFACRYFENGFALDTASNCLYFKDSRHEEVLALLNSVVADKYLTVLNPTMNFSCGVVGLVPYIKTMDETITYLAKKCIWISKLDWDSFETSWDFQRHPLLSYGVSIYQGLADSMDEAAPVSVHVDQKHGGMLIYEKNAPKNFTIQSAFEMWKDAANARFNQLKANEEELNRIFIDIYGLQDELTPEVEDKEVTVRKADLQREVKSLISYAVGCMLGRYSLDGEGLAYAGGEWDENKYSSFIPEKDAILPICDDEYFSDDIVGRFVDFIRIVYGEETLNINLQFIADALGGKGQPKDVIRSYFMNDFYADHLKIYQKRPIYWLFDSGKKNGFKCLIYMHRYQPDTIARIRTDYVHEQQSRYRTAIADLQNRIANASTGERVKLTKKLKTLQEQAEEIRVYEEKIHHLADQMISIDLDDGVKHNYELFKDVLAKIK